MEEKQEILDEMKEIDYNIKKLYEPKKEELKFSIIVDGDQKTGKTSIIEKFIENNNSNYNNNSSNLGIISKFSYIEIDNTIIKLDIIDFTINDITKRSVNNYKNGDIIFFVYSINDFISFEKVKRKISLMSLKSKYIFLVGNKDDLEDKKVYENDSEKLVNKYNINFFIEVSAETGKNIDNLFFAAIKLLYKNKKNEKSSNVKVKNKVLGTYKANDRGSKALNFLFPS